MNILIKCFECGGKLSSKLDKCVHCGKWSFPVPCQLCAKPGKYSELEDRFHPSCQNNLRHTNRESQNYSCPVCRELFSKPGLLKACHQCGHPIPIAKCSFCGENMFSGSGVKYSIMYWDDSGELSGYTSHEKEFHISCGALIVERVNKSRMSKDICKLCGGRLGRFSVFRGRDKHKECSHFMLREEEFQIKGIKEAYIQSFVTQTR